MAFCRVVFPLLVVSVLSCYASKVPVFLWGDSLKRSIRSNPLTTYSSAEYAGIMKQVLVDDPLTLVFVEETLSVDDLSLKSEDGETYYPYLHDNLGEAIYLPSVKDVLPTLKTAAGPDAINISPEELVPVGSKFVFINLNDAREGESRPDMLRRHDAFMQETMIKMSEDLNVIGVYTANYPSWTIPVTKSRVRRAVEGTRNARLYDVTGLRMTATNIIIKSGNFSRVLGEVTDQRSVQNISYVNATLVFDNTTLTLNFKSRGGYWFFDNVGLTMGDVVDVLNPTEGVYAVLGFSYRCSQHVTFTSGNQTQIYSVSFDDLKIQPFFNQNETQQFGDPSYCVGYFSAGILGALFVVFILLAITFYGLMMILDIKTMDRFDDPKGKTITINAGE